MDLADEEASDEGLFIGEDGGSGRARSERSWSETSMFSSRSPRRDLLEDVEGDETAEDGLFRPERRVGVPKGPDRGDDMLDKVTVIQQLKGQKICSEFSMATKMCFPQFLLSKK